ncbi:MAG: hypothetical protein Q8R26_04025 [bacterium]|nr:hypothetical protein [bacterium]
MDQNAILSRTAFEVMSKNEKFLLKNFKDVMDEIVELANDAIDFAQLYARQDKNRRLGEKATHFYAYHVLMPTSYAIFTSLLTGNLPACFRELRFMVEMLAKCFLADAYYPNISFFRDKLHALENRDGEKRIAETVFIKEFSDKTGLAGVVTLWKALSEEGHARKFVERVVENIVEKDNIPGYALVIPMPYIKKDIGDLSELNSYVISFRDVLNRTLS